MAKEQFDIDVGGDIDEETFVKMQEQERESGRSGRVQTPKEPPLPPSRYSVETLKKTKDGKVLVKCITLLRPWASGKQMYFWRDYVITPEEAILMDQRRFCVPLQQANQSKSTEGASE